MDLIHFQSDEHITDYSTVPFVGEEGLEPSVSKESGFQRKFAPEHVITMQFLV